ncbi:GreA/GreB family elongation factor [Pseudonocardia adelaidensis]|uniref:Transcription elongation factor GreA n=1 Tax=Pseudonocardia adelaidensis TaxID=648754 RepID=A0ABP9NFQ2_9PSEU
MTGTQQVWLTQDAYERLTAELRELLRQRAEHAERQAGDELHVGEERERSQRIRKLQELLQDPVVGREPPDDGIVEPGMVVTVRYENEEETETLLFAERDEGVPPGIEVCSPGSPLGRALVGAEEGEQRSYPLPDGRTMAVWVVRAVPYGSAAAG